MPQPDASPPARGGAIADAAEQAFEAQYGTGPGAPVCVVIAAFNEVRSVGAVVAGIPPRVAGRETECVVVDDGSGDGTAEAARAAGALVCRLVQNQGQGVALRAGYRLASRRGAEVIVTMDADGQFDPAEMPALVEPILSGRADMAQGSRRLGRSETTDRFRAAGVVLFGALVSVLTGTRITDPANGYRAFRPAVAAAVPLRQPQYQTAELLIGALARGFRVVEVPVTVLARTAGESKKGPNLLYGYRFARVIVATWWSGRRGGAARGSANRPETDS